MRARYGGRPHVSIFMIADMRGVPFLIPKSLIRSRIRAEKLPVPLLPDWDEEVNTLFGVDRKRIDIFVVGPTGAIALRQQAGGFADADCAALIERLDDGLSSQYPPEFATAATP